MKRISFTPAQSLVTGFMGLIFLGTILLSLPAASASGHSASLIDAFFTATSAVTTTGLVVVDTGTFYSFFGQLAILFLVQIGGLGYMIFVALIVLGLGKKLTISSRILLHVSLAHPTSFDVKKFVKVVIIFTFLFELVGAGILCLYWMKFFTWEKALYYGVFHSISSFCTAGFALFSDSFSAWQGSLYFNAATIGLSIAGGIGFLVLYDIYTWIVHTLKHQKSRRLLVYTKFVLVLTGLLITAGAVIIFIDEKWPDSFGLKQKILAALFQSVSASTTTGFNTIDIGSMAPVSMFFLLILMFIGASPGGTGGGIKTTTFGLVVLFLVSFFKGREEVHLFKRRVSYKIINKALALSAVAMLWLTMVAVVLTATENEPFLKMLFEVASALGTTGLSAGITPELTFTGKVLIALTMFVGRLGPLAIGYSMLGNTKPKLYQYATAEILVG